MHPRKHIPPCDQITLNVNPPICLLLLVAFSLIEQAQVLLFRELCTVQCHLVSAYPIILQRAPVAGYAGLSFVLNHVPLAASSRI